MAKFQFAWNFAEFSRNTVGTLAEVLPAGTKLEVLPSNLAGTSRVMVIATNPQGKKQSLICSTSISNMIRSKEVRLSQLGQFPVEPRTQQDSEGNDVVVPYIVKPTPIDSPAKEFSLDSNAEQWAPVEIENIEELVAF